MKLTVERLPESQVRLDIAADDAEFAGAMDKAYRKVVREVQVPGFRKGKAPRHIVERMFGRGIFLEEAHKELMDDLYRQAVKEADVVPVGDPELEFINPEPLQFKVTVPVYPTIDPGNYLDVRVDPVDATIEESQVDEVIAELRRQHSPLVEVAEPRKPIDGDQVTIDLTITGEDGEAIQDPIEGAVFVLGESQLFEPLKLAIMDLLPGETTDTTIAFEEDDEAAIEHLRGKAVTYNVTLKTVKERDLLPLDDEFAKAHGDTETLEALRTDIRGEIHQRRTREARAEVTNAIIAKIAEGGSIEIPAAMIDDAVSEEVERLRQQLSYRRSTLESYLRAADQTEDELKESLRPTVTTRLRNSLFLREVAEREGIGVTDEDLERELDEITARADDPARMREIYGGDRYMRGVLRNDLFDRRLTDRLIAIATEGRDAVINGYVAPPDAETTGETVIEANAEIATEPAATDAEA